MTYSKCYYHELCIANIWHIRHGVEHRCIRNNIGRRSDLRWIGFDATGWFLWSKNNAIHITIWLGVGSVHVYSVFIFASKWIRHFQLPLAACRVLITHHFHFKRWCRSSGQYMYGWEFSTKGLPIFSLALGALFTSNQREKNDFIQIRPIGMIFYSLMLNGVALLGEKFFPVLVEIIHLHGFLLFLGINCCLGMVFVAFMKETKGQSLDSKKLHKNTLPADTDDKQNRFWLLFF